MTTQRSQFQVTLLVGIWEHSKMMREQEIMLLDTMFWKLHRPNRPMVHRYQPKDRVLWSHEKQGMRCWRGRKWFVIEVRSTSMVKTCQGARSVGISVFDHHRLYGAPLFQQSIFKFYTLMHVRVLCCSGFKWLDLVSSHRKWRGNIGPTC